jgi:DNA/RNA-binding domain of Phe-tRNA-synthetase-like protein
MQRVHPHCFAMHFYHSEEIWATFPTLKVGALHVSGVSASMDLRDQTQLHLNAARRRLSPGGSGGHPAPQEGQWPEIQAWRRVYATMGLQPTQVRCASEALLRRLRQDGQLPQLHPLVDLCNAVSVHAAVPVAVFDCDRIAWPLCVRRASGQEIFTNFAGDDEHPVEGEVIYADAAGRAHARRWAHRQSRHSAVGPATSSAFIVLEAFHESASETLREALCWLTGAVGRSTECGSECRLLTVSAPHFRHPESSGPTGAP